MNEIGLVYVGEGSSLPGVPARDLSVFEASKFGIEKLLRSRLYVKPGKVSVAAPKSNKLQTGSSENKSEQDKE